jgi:hypothetical protein
LAKGAESFSARTTSQLQWDGFIKTKARGFHLIPPIEVSWKANQEHGRWPITFSSLQRVMMVGRPVMIELV